MVCSGEASWSAPAHIHHRVYYRRAVPGQDSGVVSCRKSGRTTGRTESLRSSATVARRAPEPARSLDGAICTEASGADTP